MSNRQGTPVWYELLTDDPDSALEFYSRVMGWRFDKPARGLANRDYRTFTAEDGEGVGGVMKTPDGAPLDPIWLVYYGVDNVDVATETLKALGGSVHMEPTDIPDVGRFSFVTDPQGASFYIMRGDSDQDSTAFSQMQSGHCSWNELVTSDQKAALEFYSAMFGWEKSAAMPMGDAGDYTFIQHGDTAIGAMMDAPDCNRRPFWNFAFNVDDIDDAKSAVEEGGGIVRHGPMKLPDDYSGWLIQVTDPQGAKIMFTGARRG